MQRILSAAMLLSLAVAHSKEEWRDKTIYQILTDRFYRTDGSTEDCSDLHLYCGGTFKGIESQLDYIKGMGFDAIWISPIPENLGNDYHGYAGLNWYNINPYFGTPADLKSLVSSAHSLGIWVMLDVVGNHVAPVDEDYAQVTPFNEEAHYHTKCQIENWYDQNEVEYCRIFNLPDLDQENEFVRQFLKDWVKEQVDTYGFDGIRVDTTQEVAKDFWLEYAESAGVFQIGEIYDTRMDYVGGYQGGAFDATMNYPMYFTLRDVFDYKQSMYKIRDTFTNEANYFSDRYILGLFFDNHDNPRFLSLNPSTTLLKSAVTFVLMGPGIPIIYYGTEQYFSGQTDPENREALWPYMNTESEMYKYIAVLNNLRREYGMHSEEFIERWADDNFYAFTRGKVLIALTNDDSGATQSREITYHPYEVGQKLCNINYTGDCVYVSDSNTIEVTLLHGEVKIFIPAEEDEQAFLQ